MSYSTQQRRYATAWKTHTDVLPPAAKASASYVGKSGRPGGTVYGFCLPAEFAQYNLLPEVRDDALALFAELGIPWHAGIDGGPGNHLLSSQVQCVNALGQMVTDPARVAAAFAGTVQIGEVLEIECGRYLTFEYIGPTDFFGEAPGGDRIRGTRCTSVDAAFLHRALDGRRELVLVEWKYTESYRLRNPEPARDETRRRRYAAAVADPDGPVRDDVLPFELLLAYALERAGVADRVRIVHVLPPQNEAYQGSLVREEHRALGTSVSQVWQRLLRRPDRYTVMDPAVFLDAALTSREYVLRYASDVVWNEQGLANALGVGGVDQIEDALHWDGDLELDGGAVFMRVGTTGTGLQYPFRLTELQELAAELEQ
jgi:hypothetical protein